MANERGKPSIVRIAGLALLALAVMLAGGVWWSNRSETTFERETALNLGFAMLAEGESHGIANVLISPTSGGKAAMVAEFHPAEGNPAGAGDKLSITFTGLGSGELVGPHTFDIVPELVSDAREIELASQQMWQVDVVTQSDGNVIARGIAGFYLPDPNRNGNDAIALGESDPSAQALFDLGADTLTRLHRVQYDQWFTDGNGLAVVSIHAINDGSDGSNARFTYQTPGGLDAIVIGTDLWSRKGDEPWQQSETNPPIMPSNWLDEYSGAKGFQMGPILELSQGTCQYITFEVPEELKRSVAWYAWCVNPDTGDLYRDLMVSRDHYMTSDFYGHDGDVEILPPSSFA